ncbi:MAG: DUF1585 domain-containing protein [Sandaracinus sp.]
MARTPRWLWMIAFLGVFVAPGAVRSDEAQCRVEVPRMGRDEYLRSLSLDLRGVIPTLDEHDAIAAMDDVPESLVDEWLSSDEMTSRVVRRHRGLLWPNVENVRFVHFARRLGTTGSGAAQRYWRSSSTIAVPLRGVSPAVPCDDVPATFEADGTPHYRVDAATGAHIEGYVEVEPYWAPGTTVHVCAFDAMTNARSPLGRDCSARESVSDPGCGCGTNLRWCDVQSVQDALVAAFATDVERRVAANASEGEAYTDLFASRRAFVNGPMAFYYRNQLRLWNDVPLEPSSMDVAHLPDLAYSDATTWVEVELPDYHAGVLTSPLYLLRFQTNRARANHFYDAFLCQPFQPPAGGIPVGNEVEARETDLQRRAGCRYCHAILEPAASHWGRWLTQSAAHLDEERFPSFLPECAECARGEETCSSTCNLAYVTRALSPSEEPYLGMLRSYEFLRPEHEGYVAEGPMGLVRDGLADGRFTRCTVRRTAEWLLGRSLAEDEAAWSDELASTFVGSDMRYRDVVRAIVTSDTYRRVR